MYTNGAIISKKDVRDYRIVAATQNELPIEYETLNVPAVKNQTTFNACVGYAMSVIIEWYCRLYGDELNDISPFYIYGNRRNTTHKGYGMIVRDTLKSVVEYGSVIESVFPYKQEVPEIIDTFENNQPSLFVQGFPNRISSFYRCQTINEIKTAVMKHGIVLMAMEWFDDITVKKGIINTKAIHSVNNGHHAMVIYGWDENGWKIQNSWGTSWGNNGRAILPFNVPINEAWGIIDEISENHRKQEIERLEKSNLELQNKISELLNTYGDNKALYDLLDEYMKQIEAQQQEIERLNAENIELRKPFSTNFGKACAKIINFFINVFKK